MFGWIATGFAAGVGLLWWAVSSPTPTKKKDGAAPGDSGGGGDLPPPAALDCKAEFEAFPPELQAHVVKVANDAVASNDFTELDALEAEFHKAAKEGKVTAGAAECVRQMVVNIKAMPKKAPSPLANPVMGNLSGLSGLGGLGGPGSTDTIGPGGLSGGDPKPTDPAGGLGA